MKALTFYDKQEIQYNSVEDPTIISADDVIVRVKLTAVCGSDLHIYHGRETGLDVGTIMGHEFVGEVVEKGPGVSKIQQGDIVIAPFTTNCGKCFYCQKNLPSRCSQGQLFGWVENGEGLHGGQAELVRVPLADATLLKKPEDVSLEEALLLGDILSTGYFCADMADIQTDGICCVVGCGPVGLLAILSAKELGAKSVYAIDSVDYRLDLARKFGAIPINYLQEDPLAIVKEATAGRGADAVLEIVGSEEAGRLAYKLIRPGGIISVVGVHTDKTISFSPVEAYDKNITFKIGRCPARYYMEKLIPLVQSKKYDFSAIISHRLPLSQGVEGYKIFDKKLEDCTKVVLEP